MTIKGKNALSFPILNKVHQVEFVLALCYFPVSVNDIVEKTHVFFIPFSWAEKKSFGHLKDRTFEATATKIYEFAAEPQKTVLSVY